MSVYLSRTHGNTNYKHTSNPVNTSSKRQNRTNKTDKKFRLQTASSTHTKKNRELPKQSNSSSLPNDLRNMTNKSESSNNGNHKPPNYFSLILLTLIRLGIVGVGLATILGTVLANIDLTKPLFPGINLPFVQTSESTKIQAEVKPSTPTSPSPSPEPSKEASNSFPLNHKLTSLEQKFAAFKKKYPQLEAGAFFIDLDSGSYADYNGSTVFPAASTIKIPILVAFFEDVDAGKIYLDEKFIMDKEVISGGSGSMQSQKPGTEYTALYTATEMIINSDNTATNMIIRRLGGAEELNKRFQSWGLEVTAIKNPLPDLEGTNTTSPKDLAYVLSRVNNGELVSLKSRDRLLDIMQQTKTKTLLPQGLEKDAVIAHKTGDIGKVLGDAGIIDIPTGKRYIGAVLVKRPHNDYTTRTLIQEISRTAYQHFKWYLPHPPLEKKT